MSDEPDVITIELEVDSIDDGDRSRMRPGVLSRVGEGADAIVIELAQTEVGHGFGLSEVVTIVVSIGVGASSDIVADAIRAAIGKVIRRSKAGSRHSDGSREGLTELIEGERSCSSSKSVEASSPDRPDAN
jgi:hypothetical protein